MRVVILVGNIGTGKSTLAQQLVDDGFLTLNTDSLVRSLNNGWYKFNPRLGELYRGFLVGGLELLLKNGLDVCVDCTNVTIEGRCNLLKTIRGSGNYPQITSIGCYDFGCGDESSLQRRLANSRVVSEVVWRKVHTKFKNDYDEPTMDEGFDFIEEVIWGKIKY